jgi:hypothetical protein
MLLANSWKRSSLSRNAFSASICSTLALARAAFAAAIAERARQPFYDPQQDAGGEAAPGG